MENEAHQKMINSLSNYKNTTSVRARERVLGHGPDRKLLPAFKYICDLPEEFILELNNFFEINKFKNDLEIAENYQISDHCPLKYALPEGFHHILLTRCEDNFDPRDEHSYTRWTNEALQMKFTSWFQAYFPGAFRVRLSLLPIGEELSWHIDTNTSVACRCSIALDDAKASFEIKIKSNVNTVPLSRGSCYFTNTGYPHRVYNNSFSNRLNLVFGIDFKNIKKWFKQEGEKFI